MKAGAASAAGMLLRALILAAAGLAGGCGQPAPSAEPETSITSRLGNSTQLLLVVSDNWDSSSARLQCYDRPSASQQWRAAGETITVSIGRTGLAWGRGVHGINPLAGPVKREGDGKAPAGIFELPTAFGYAPSDAARQVKLPYLPLTSNVVGVDDSKSRYYNQIVQLDQVTKDWDSFEQMRRSDGLYEWGVVVNHNTSPVVSGGGSCIFLHIWRGPNKLTAGCTAMSREHMIQLVKWLDPQKRPLLVQLPYAQYQQLKSIWQLP